MNSKAFSFLGYLIAVAGLLFLIFNNLLFSTNPVTILIQVASAGLMIWARITFGMRSFHATANTTKGELVTTGPYSRLRHPIYASVIYFSLACLIPNHVPEAFAGVAIVICGLYLRMLLEEKELSKTYPEYKAYCQKAKRIIPFLF